MNRRSALSWAIGGIGAAATAMTGIPSLVTAFAPLILSRRNQSVWRSIGTEESFTEGTMRKIVVSQPDTAQSSSLGDIVVYALRSPGAGIVVYSRSCTDLGCPLTYDSGSECFFCPCHGGIFDKYGNRLSGPPSKPLHRYRTRMSNGRVLIDLRSIPPPA